VIVLLDLVAEGVLSEECFSHLSEVVEVAWWQRVEPIRGHAFQADRKGEAHDMIITGIDHHLVSKVADVLHRITQSGVVVECWSREFL